MYPTATSTAATTATTTAATTATGTASSARTGSGMTVSSITRPALAHSTQASSPAKAQALATRQVQQSQNSEATHCLPSCQLPPASADIKAWDCSHAFHEQCLRQWPQLEAPNHLPEHCPTCEADYVDPEQEPEQCNELGGILLMSCFWTPALMAVAWVFWDFYSGIGAFEREREL